MVATNKNRSKSRSQIVNDFDKRKTKLGKGKQLNNNATNTSFKARSIALPQQSIGKDRQNVPVTRRNLNLDDLLGQLRHPNSNVRRDAINGLEELLRQTEKGLSFLPLSKLIPNLIRLLSDEDLGVRKTLLQFWKQYVKRIQSKRIKPYVSIIVLHITSSMSHIFPDIRIDSVKFLSICLSSFGDIMVGGWQYFDGKGKRSNGDQFGSTTEQEFGARILRCYLTLLGISNESNSNTGMKATSQSRASIISTDLSSNSKYIILSSLELFLIHALGRGNFSIESEEGKTLFDDFDLDNTNSQSNDYPDWIFTSYLQNEADQMSCLQSLSSKNKESTYSSDTMVFGAEDFLQSLGKNGLDRQEPFSESFQSVVMRHYEIGSKKDLEDSHLTSFSSHSDIITAQLELFHCLVPLLQICFLEASPSVLDSEFTNGRSANDESKNLNFQIIHTVISVSLHLWRGVDFANGEICKDLSNFLDRIAPHFPLGGSQSNGNGKREINLRGEEKQETWLDINLSFCELVGLLSTLSQSKPVQNKKEKKLENYVNLVSNYIIQLFKNKSEREALYGSRLIATLPTIWLLLNQSDQKGTEEMIDGLLQHWNGLTSNSSSKAISTKFIGHLILMPTFPSYIGTFTILNNNTFRIKVIRWLTVSLPKRLWELNDKSLKETNEILEILRRVTMSYGRKDEFFLTEIEVKELIKPFSTFFSVQHAKHGQIDGPFTRLPNQIQRRALAVVHNLPFDSDLDTAVKLVHAF